ncbi:hypothetical protein YC2023_079113 [Brassica napus]
MKLRRCKNLQGVARICRELQMSKFAQVHEEKAQGKTKELRRQASATESEKRAEKAQDCERELDPD